MTRIGDIGTPAYVDKAVDIAYYVSLARFHPKTNVKGKYLYYFIQSKFFQHELWKKTIHVAFPKKINKDDIGECKIILIDGESQCKIINMMDKIEERINSQKNIIQDIISLRTSICDIISRYRGKCYKINDIADIGRGRVINSKEITQQKNPKYPVYSSQTLNNGIMGYLDNYDFDGEYITWTTDGANAGTVFYHNEKFNCTNVCGIIKITVQNIVPFYLSLILESACKKYVSSNLANPKLMNNTVASILVSIPEEETQYKASNLVKSLDTKLLNEEKILELYQKQKNYLLNKMFI